MKPQADLFTDPMPFNLAIQPGEDTARTAAEIARRKQSEQTNQAAQLTLLAKTERK